MLKMSPCIYIYTRAAYAKKCSDIWNTRPGVRYTLFGCQIDEPYSFPADQQPDATMLKCTYWYLPWIYLIVSLLCSVGNKTYYHYYYSVVTDLPLTATCKDNTVMPGTDWFSCNRDMFHCGVGMLACYKSGFVIKGQLWRKVLASKRSGWIACIVSRCHWRPGILRTHPLPLIELMSNGKYLRNGTIPGLILGLCPANERRRYNVTPSLIDRAQT